MAKREKRDQQLAALSAKEKRSRKEKQTKADKLAAKREKERRKQEKKRKKQEKVPRTAQQSIPYLRMFQDGICQVTKTFFSKTVQFYDINYQLALNEDKTAIFENYCDFLNYFDSSISVQLSFINQQVDVAEFERTIDIPSQEDAFNGIREEYKGMLKDQLSKGNKRVNATISLEKQDSETGGKAQGDATFKGAVYGLYAREDIVHPDGKTGVLYKAGAQVATLTTDAKGLAEVKNLYLGKYYIKEITPPEGYLIDAKEHDINCSYEGATVPTVKRSVISKEDVKKQPFQVIKAADNGKTDADLLKGAGFTAWLVSSLTKNADGSYDFQSAPPVVITADGAMEMITDEKGHAVSIPLPYGKYIVKETTIPHNFDPVDDFYVTITENKPSTPQVWRVLLDKEFEAKLKVIKKDDESGRPVLIAGTEFKIYDLDNKKYVEQVTTYPEVKTHTSYYTDAKGYLILPNNLKIGNYRIEEVTAPEGYTLNPTTIEISVDANTAYLVDGTSGDTIIEVICENHPVKGELSVYKKGEVVSKYNGTDFEYEEQFLKGAEFDVYAAENIYTADYQKDDAGTRLLEYAEGDLVTTITTGEDGLAVAKDLPLGKYLVKEKNAPEGFVLNADSQEADFEYVDQNTAVIKESLTFTNDRQKVAITVTKQDAENDAVVAGAEFGLYNTADIVNTSGEIIVKYYVKEVETAEGYVLDGELRYVDLSYRDQDTPVVTYDEDWQNNRQRVSVNVLKKEKGTDRLLEGGIFGLFAAEDILSASGKVLLEADEVIEQKATDAKGQIKFNADLPINGKYYVKEIYAPDGFVTTEEKQEFTFEYGEATEPVVVYDFAFENEPTTVEITKSDLTNGEELPGARLKLTDKDGNVIDEWTSTKESHVIKELAVGKTYTLTETKPADGYVTAESMEFVIENTTEVQKHEMKDDVTKVKICKTDITGDVEIPGAKITILDENDQVVESWISTKEPYYVEKLPIGKYKLREEQAPKGYILSTDVNFQVKDTGEIQMVTMKDDTAKGKVIINKTDADNEEPLKGVEFELRDSKGKVLEKLVTDAAGHAESGLYEIATYNKGKFGDAIKYYLVETKALDGYALDSTQHEIIFEYVDQNTPVIEITKDLTNKETEPEQPGTSSRGGSPKTGDDTNLWLPLLGMVLSASALALLIFGRRKRYHKQPHKQSK